MYIPVTATSEIGEIDMTRLAAKGIVHPEMKIVLEFTHSQVFMLFLFQWNTEENIYIFEQLYDIT